MKKKDFSITILSTRSGMIVIERSFAYKSRLKNRFGKDYGVEYTSTGKGEVKMIYITGDCHSNFERFNTRNFPEQKEMTKDDYCKPWKFTSSDGRFEMDFQPVLDRSACMDYKLIVSDQHQVFGRMSGTAVLDDGMKIEIKDVLCFAEKVHNRY